MNYNKNYEIKKIIHMLELLLEDTSDTNVVMIYDYIDNYLNLYKKGKVRDRTFNEYYINIRLHIRPYLDNKPLSALTSDDVQKVLNNCKSSRICESVYLLFNMVLNKAFNQGLLKYNIMGNVDYNKHIRDKSMPLTLFEEHEFVSAIKNSEYESIFLFLLWTGCRRSEALLLKWNDIDFDKKIIHIKGTKSITSDRYIPMFNNVYILLTKLYKKNNFDKVFYYRKDTLTHVFKNYCSNHQLRHLRNTAGTRWLEAGVPVKVVSEWLGHADTNVTEHVYIKVLEDYSMSFVDCVDKYIKN